MEDESIILPALLNFNADEAMKTNHQLLLRVLRRLAAGTDGNFYDVSTRGASNNYGRSYL